MSRPVIVSNQVRCLLCGDTPFSGSVHDFRECKCGAVAVDGGQEYLKRAYNDGTPFEEMSITMDRKAVEDCMGAVKWGRETKRNDRGIAYAVMRALRDNDLLSSRREKAVVKAAEALIADIHARFPGEELTCPHMRALDEALHGKQTLNIEDEINAALAQGNE